MQSLALALLSVVAAATSQQSELALLNYAAKFGKTYTSVVDMKMHSDNYQKSLGKRDQLRADFPSATFGDTPFSDWSDKEWSTYLNLRVPDRSVGDAVGDAEDGDVSDDEGAGRRLQTLADIDWVTAGIMIPVKNQGNCGSCAPFAVTTIIEAMESKKSGNAAVRLSEQQGLDCARNSPYNNYSCNGGWMDSYMQFYSDNGAMLNSDYPYQMVDQACTQTSSSPIAVTSDWSSFVSLPYQASVAAMHAELVKGPLSVALNASYWGRDYTGGIVTDANLNCDYRTLNHGVTVVGYTAGGSTTTSSVDVPDLTACYRLKRRSACSSNTMEVSSGRRLYCCEYTTEDQTVTSPGYWTIQNSWGSNWGEAGFIKIQAQDGYGVCGINSYVDGIDVL